jgi:putative Mg2+ transporter-C (MgtC) family protein
VRFRRNEAISEATLRELLAQHGFTLHGMSYRLHGDTNLLEYRSVVRTMKPANMERLSASLSRDPKVLEFRVAPTSE